MTREEYREGRTGARTKVDGIVHDKDAFRQQDATRCRAIERWWSTLVINVNFISRLYVLIKSHTNSIVN